MPYATDNASFICGRGVFILALFSSVALGGCQSPMHSGTSDTYSYSVAPSHPSYVGGNAAARAAEPAQQAWTSEQKYEYRGGRDPVSGRASTQI